MEKYTGLLGIFTVLLIAYCLSNNKKAINFKLVITGLVLQVVLALFILKTTVGQTLFSFIAHVIRKLLSFSDAGAEFVFGVLARQHIFESGLSLHPGEGFIFAVKLVPTIIFVASLVSIVYYLGIMQKIVAFIAKIVIKVMNVSGSEAISNAASVFVGQIEAQLLIKPYVKGMTNSELLASMSGSMACIAGGVMAVYISMGVDASYLLAASLMAIPGALIISKIVIPETEESETKGVVKVHVEHKHVNLIDAAAYGALEGMKIAVGVVTILVAFLAIVAMIDGFLGLVGKFLLGLGLNLQFIGIDLTQLSLQKILGALFALMAFLMGVPPHECVAVGSLMGTKIVLNEFVAYIDMLKMTQTLHLSNKAVVISTFALCGFANFGSIGMQIGGIGEIAPERRHDLAKLGIKALICGTLASYMSAALAGIIL